MDTKLATTASAPSPRNPARGVPPARRGRGRGRGRARRDVAGHLGTPHNAMSTQPRHPRPRRAGGLPAREPVDHLRRRLGPVTAKLCDLASTSGTTQNQRVGLGSVLAGGHTLRRTIRYVIGQRPAIAPGFSLLDVGNHDRKHVPELLVAVLHSFAVTGPWWCPTAGVRAKKNPRSQGLRGFGSAGWMPPREWAARRRTSPGEGPVCTQPRKPPLRSSDGVGLRCGGEGHPWGRR